MDRCFSVIFRYDPPMSRPPRLPDTEIQQVIDELRARHGMITGIELRAELQRRHGHRGGVSRIYRLLRQPALPHPAPSPPTQHPEGDLSELQAQLTAAVERARLAEHREETHQVRWAGEIHALREQVRSLHDASHRLAVIEADLRDRSRELAAAYHRIADLEAQLERLSSG
jgi:hypothetical protein